MTASTPVHSRRETVYSIMRILFGGILLSVLVAACLYLCHTAMPFIRDRLLETEKKTFAWFAEQIGFSLPFIAICLFHAVVYRGHPRDGMAEREMLWQIVLVTVFTYAIMLPYLSNVSNEMYAAALEAGAEIPETEGGVPWTLMMKLHEWFIRFTIPLGILWTFHAMRASRERREPYEEEETYPTVDEYYARRAAEEAALSESVASDDVPESAAIVDCSIE